MPKEKHETDETVLGIDYGDKNIGVALGKNGFASPLSIVQGTNTMTAIHELTRLALENKISKFVVGIALTGDGKETQQSIAIRKFAKLLKIVSKKPVVFINEFDSSNEALADRAFYGVSIKRSAPSDHLSAAIILKRYFDER